MTLWTEIRNEHIDEMDIDNGCVEMYIDAWKTDDENEEGNVIAKILAIKTETENIVRVVYIDNAARINDYAQEVINEGIQEVKEYKF